MKAITSLQLSQRERAGPQHRGGLSGLLLVAIFVAVLMALATPRAQAAIGPDAFGYTADSVSFTFEDISTTGTKVLADHDEFFVTAAIGFPFSFYGASHTSTFISSNGVLSFMLGGHGASNMSFTGPVLPDVPTIAPLWDDWSTRKVTQPNTDAVYYQTLGDEPGELRFVVQWHMTQHADQPAIATNTVTFQAVLYEGSNAIEYRYLDTDNGDPPTAFGADATVGIRDTAGHTNGRFLQWSHNPRQPVIGNQSAIRFCLSDDDDDNDGLSNGNEVLLLTLLGSPDSDADGVVDGNDDANNNRVDDEDEDDNDGCPDRDSDDDGTDDEDEDDD